MIRNTPLANCLATLSCALLFNGSPVHAQNDISDSGRVQTQGTASASQAEIRPTARSAQIDEAMRKAQEARLRREPNVALGYLRFCEKVPECDYEIGMTLRSPQYTTNTSTMAYEYFQRAAKGGHARAHFWVGYIILNDELVALAEKPRRDWMKTNDYDAIPKPIESFKWFKKAAEMGDPWGTCLTAVLQHPAYSQFTGLHKDPASGPMRMVLESAGKRSPYCTFLAAMHYANTLQNWPEVVSALFHLANDAAAKASEKELGWWEYPPAYQGNLNLEHKAVQGRLNGYSDLRVKAIYARLQSSQDLEGIIAEYKQNPDDFVTAYLQNKRNVSRQERNSRVQP